MDIERRNFTDSLKVEHENKKIEEKEIQKGLDMQAHPIVVLIDDDKNFINDLKKQLPSVIFKMV